MIFVTYPLINLIRIVTLNDWCEYNIAYSGAESAALGNLR